jgi:hypothetical protein
MLGEGAGLLPSVAQPPLPLHEFLPLQPLSPVLQPPLPLQELLPLQACWSLSFFLPISSDTPALLFDVAACACTANDPLIKPAIAAPAINAFVFMLVFLFCFWSSSRRHNTAGVEQIDEKSEC